MLRALLALTLVAVAVSPAAADSRTTWQGVFVGSVSVGLLGGSLFWYGSNQVDHAERQLCTGDYGTDCGHQPPTSQAVVDELNDKGEHGETVSRVGAVMILAGGGLAAFSLYKGFIAEDRDREPAVVVAPTITSHGAGASLQLRW